MRYSYRCVLTPEVEGSFLAQFPDVRGALSQPRYAAAASALCFANSVQLDTASRAGAANPAVAAPWRC